MSFVKTGGYTGPAAKEGAKPSTPPHTAGTLPPSPVATKTPGSGVHSGKSGSAK